jgi:hypothetical protein
MLQFINCVILPLFGIYLKTSPTTKKNKNGQHITFWMKIMGGGGETIYAKT